MVKENETKILEGKGIISVGRTIVDRVLQDDMEEEVIFVRKFKTDPAFVTVKIGVTHNMGNYQSLRLDVGVSIPCYVEEISEVEKQATNWVDNRLTEKLDELKQTKV